MKRLCSLIVISITLLLLGCSGENDDHRDRKAAGGGGDGSADTIGDFSGGSDGGFVIVEPESLLVLGIVFLGCLVLTQLHQYYGRTQ